MPILQQSYKSMRDPHIKNLSINIIRAIKHFSGMEPQTIGSYEKFLLNFVSPTARKLIADMIESRFVVVSNDSQDKRKKLLELQEFDYEKFL